MMAPRDNLESYEATEARDLTRLLRALRPPTRDVPVPAPVDLAIRAAIWQAPVRRQLSMLLALARRDLIRVLRQALTDNPWLEEGAPAADEDAPAGGAPALWLTAAAGDLAEAAARYDSVWQACVPDGWEATDLSAQPSEAPGASAPPSGPPEALVVPDVMITRVGQAYHVILHEAGIPRLRLRATARRLVRERQVGEPEAGQYLDDQLCAAVWLIRSLEYRRQVLATVAQHLVTRQRAFLDQGSAHLQPLALAEVAAALDLHASTLRRVVTNTYLATARGVVALTSCFQSGPESSGGETRASLTVKERIKQLVAAEDPAQPLTDQQLVEALAAEHVRIARRTATQYRRELQLPPAHRRQRISDVQVFCHACGALRPTHGVPCRACGFVDPTPVVEIGTVAEKDTTLSIGPLAISDEEQRVRQALEAHTRRGLTEPLLGDREEASEVPPEVEEAQRHRDLAWLEWTRKSPKMQEVFRSQGLHNASVNPPLERHVRELLALYEIGQALSSVHDLDHLLQLASERVVTLLDIESASIILLDEERQELYFKVAYDSRVGHDQCLRDWRFPAKQGIAGWVIHEGQSLIVPDVDHDPRHYRGVDDHTGTKTRSIAAVPLRTKDRIIGVLEAINKIKGVFTSEDVRLLEAFANQLALALENARLIQELRTAQERLSEENRYWREAMVQRVQFETLVGESPKMQEVFRLVERVLHATATVLLTGERGTGQDRIVRLLHDRGPRAQGPFIAVNCAAISETLLEAELFGDERGAFPGVTQRTPGRLELAAGGTLFLEEIDALSPALQAKLLRALQEKQFERVGGTGTLTHDARIVAATNQDLERLVAEGKFRRDLYYRLNVYPIALPPLRERQEDLGPLTMHFLKRFSQELRKEVVGISKEAVGLLERYFWPGNVRELAEVIEQVVARCQGVTVTAQDLPQALREQFLTPVSSGEAVQHPARGIALADLEKQILQQALEQAHQNKSQAARLLGLSRTQLRTRMRHYGLE